MIEPDKNQNAIVARELPPLAAGLVHEVRNPLAAIHLHLQLLESYIGQVRDPELREKMQGKARVIKTEIMNLNQTLQDFLRMLREERVEKQIGDLNTAVREVIELLEPQARQEHIDLAFRPGELGSNTVFEPTFVKQILVNLILNSVQAFEKAKQQADKRIFVETGMEGKNAFFRVRDNGPGISPEVQARIFEPFFSTKEEGSGLGLSLVQKMTGEMGGDIRVSSVPDEGAEFTIVLGRTGLQ
ncbi:MAG TPA: HAMP domain-containing sensor histidine kinase [Leptospiraceae bacterium]|jgi:signal transduction histidine kinase|nr:HAMP domain-containing sensor histidine kinase [Leptospiraceae bacterium]